MGGSGSPVLRRRLGDRLKDLRKSADDSAAEAGARIGISETKILRIEAGKLPVRVADVMALCKVYDVDDETEAMFVELAKATTGSAGWWQDFSDVTPAWFALYLDFEANADRIFIHEQCLIHGLFQTADYVAAVFRAARPDASTADVDRQVRVRLERQQAILHRPNPPQVTAVFDEGALVREVGGPTVAAAQLERLRNLSEQNNITVRVLPFTAGAYAAMTGTYTLLDYRDPADPPVVYLESQIGARYEDRDEQVADYRRLSGLILEQSVPIKEWRSGWTKGPRRGVRPRQAAGTAAPALRSAATAT